MHWRRKWQPTPVFLPGESQGQGSLMGCRLWGRTESDTTEATYQQQQQQLLCSRQILYVLSLLGIPSTPNFAFCVEAREKEFQPHLEVFVFFLRVTLSGHLKGLCVGGSSSNHNDCL